MPDRHHRMMKYHPGARIAHNGSDHVSFIRLITVNFAIGTEGLVFHERASVTSLMRISDEILTFFAQLISPSSMVVVAIQSDHLFHNFLFFSSLVFKILHQLSLPFSTVYDLSAILMVEGRWETRITVLFCADSFNDFRMMASFRLSRLLVGSSRRIMSES